jgi:alpha-L-rhamnosidase
VPAFQQDTLILAGTGNETWQPRFTWHAFRYVQLDGWPTATMGPPTPGHFTGLQVHTANTPAGSFIDWNPQHNAIDALTHAAFRANWAGGIQSDCPGRERLGYGGDLQVSAEAAILQFDAANFYAKRVNDYADAARANGGLPETAPFIGIETCDTIGGGTSQAQK